MSTFFQAGMLPALLQNVYEGDMTFEKLAQHGDIGLGIMNHRESDMLALDGEFYRVNADGEVHSMELNASTPFSIVTKFKPTQIFSIENVNSVAELNQLLDLELATKNIFYFVRIDAELESLKLQSDQCPFLHNTQYKTHELTRVRGSLIATRCPDYSDGFTITGFHYHFINQERSLGGHVAELKIKRAKVMVTPMRRFSVVLINNNLFDEANL